MTILEVARTTIKAGLNVMDETSEAGQILTGIWETIILAPDGPPRIFWGVEVENPSKFWMFMEWASVADHEKFASSLGEELTEKFSKIMDSEFARRVVVKPYPPEVLRSAVTEVMFAYFPSEISQRAKDANSARFREFAKSLETYVQGVSYGWGVENDFPVREENQKGTLFTAFIGWESIDAHMKFRETQAFKENIHLVRNMDELVKLGLFHIHCKSIQRKGD